MRVAGISATAQDPANPRYSTSEALLQVALAHARGTPSTARRGSSNWPNSDSAPAKVITPRARRPAPGPVPSPKMDDTDQMTEVYEAMVHWADVVLLATPIRWGQASSLYFRMAERLNCVQNQITLKDRVLLRNKVAGFIITGGQDNIQGVAGQLLTLLLGTRLLSSRSFPLSPTRAAGRPRTWNGTSPPCSRARNCAKARERSSNGPWRPPPCARTGRVREDRARGPEGLSARSRARRASAPPTASILGWSCHPSSDRWTCLNQGHDGDHGLLAEGPVGEEPGPTLPRARDARR